MQAQPAESEHSVYILNNMAHVSADDLGSKRERSSEGGEDSESSRVRVDPSIALIPQNVVSNSAQSLAFRDTEQSRINVSVLPAAESRLGSDFDAPRQSLQVVTSEQVQQHPSLLNLSTRSTDVQHSLSSLNGTPYALLGVVTASANSGSPITTREPILADTSPLPQASNNRDNGGIGTTYGQIAQNPDEFLVSSERKEPNQSDIQVQPSIAIGSDFSHSTSIMGASAPVDMNSIPNRNTNEYSDVDLLEDGVPFIDPFDFNGVVTLDDQAITTDDVNADIASVANASHNRNYIEDDDDDVIIDSTNIVRPRPPAMRIPIPRSTLQRLLLGEISDDPYLTRVRALIAEAGRNDSAILRNMIQEIPSNNAGDQSEGPIQVEEAVGEGPTVVVDDDDDGDDDDDEDSDDDIQITAVQVPGPMVAETRYPPHLEASSINDYARAVLEAPGGVTNRMLNANMYNNYDERGPRRAAVNMHGSLGGHASAEDIVRSGEIARLQRSFRNVSQQEAGYGRVPSSDRASNSTSNSINSAGTSQSIVQSILSTNADNAEIIRALSNRLTCPICLGTLDKPASTTCGHLFCFDCIRQAVGAQKQCPMCRTPLRPYQVHRIYW